MPGEKINIRGLTLGELEEFAVSAGEKKFRGRQLFSWLYSKEAAVFSEMTSISKQLRDKLGSIASIDSLKLIARSESANDCTEKFLFELAGGGRIECVLIPPRTAFAGTEAGLEEEQRRLTLCISTQAGCPLDCIFCATAAIGFKGNLTPGEIIAQVLQVKKISGRRITNLVYMGMGEPLLNYESVMKSVEIITTGMNIAARRITVSTAGWVPGIRRIADEGRKFKLAVSLHTLDEKTRRKLMPAASKFSLGELIDAVSYYYKKMKRRVTFEYILIEGWNDGAEDITRLVSLSRKVPCKVNIIPLHRTGAGDASGLRVPLKPVSSIGTEEFATKLREAHLTVFVRSSAGEDIDAACGQLAAKIGARHASVNIN